jgi:hypothetical protein
LLPRRRAALALALALVAGACEAETPASGAQRAPELVAVTLAGRELSLELASDAKTRGLGLGGRTHIPPDGGMLFAFPDPRPLSFVMRDCVVPIDLALLDAGGRVVSIHHMAVEPPRRPSESPFAYESRLRLYTSPSPAQFAVEMAGGRLAELGVRVGDFIGFDRAAVLQKTE